MTNFECVLNILKSKKEPIIVSFQICLFMSQISVEQARLWIAFQVAGANYYNKCTGNDN